MQSIRVQPPSRHFALQGASNFRDLGGYATADGRQVRWRRIFRSNHLGELTPADLDVLRPLDLRKVFDFRGEDEVTRDGAGRLAWADRHPVPIVPVLANNLHQRHASGEALDAEATRSVMCTLYRSFVHDHTTALKPLFGHLLADGSPLVFHCTAGKDRTGFAAALVLLALGVPRATVLQDYLLTNQHWRMGPSTRAGLPQEVAEVLGSAEAAFLEAALDTVDEDFGGLDAYLRQEIGVGPSDRRALEERYLEAA